MKAEDILARLEKIWSDADAIRSDSWFHRAWLRVSLRRRRVVGTALAHASARLQQGDGWRGLRGSVVDELGENLQLLEDSARAGEAIDPCALSWLFDVARWVRALDRSHRNQAFSPAYALRHGLASRAMHAPLKELPVHAAMAIDAVLREALDEHELLSRRAGLLRAAQRLLLDAAASVETADVADHQRAIAEELRQLARMTQDTRADVSLREQLRSAASRRDARRMYALASARAYLRSTSTGDDVGDRLAAQLEGVWGTDGSPKSVSRAIRQGYEMARANLEHAVANAPPMQRFRLQSRTPELGAAAEASLRHMISLASTDFDVGSGLSLERRDVVETRRETVPFPTTTLALEPVDGVEGLHDAVIEDPRLLLHHLASRRLLQRRYLRAREVRRRTGAVRASVRFYLLDGSSSMRGARARMRDAIFLAELAALVARLEDRTGRVRSLLYYRYFASSASETRRVATVPEALATIEHVLSTERSGGTNIQGALSESLEMIEAQRANDVELSRAQIVLVSDGGSEVDPVLLRRAQTRLAIPVRVSIVALGEENPGLRRFAAAQRNAGLQVIYHHVGDAELHEKDVPSARALPDFRASAPARAAGASVAGEELEVLLDSLRDLGLDEGSMSTEERRALHAHRVGTRGLAQRFDALFPEPRVSPEALGPSDEAVSVLYLLQVVLEVLECAPSSGWRLQADGIAILRRLLREQGLTEARYRAVLDGSPQVFRDALWAIRDLAGS